MKSLIFSLTAILCLSFTGVLYAELPTDSLRDEEVCLNAKSREGVAERIYWRKNVKHFLSSDLPFANLEDDSRAEATLMLKHFDLYSAVRPISIASFKMSIEASETRPLFVNSNKKERWLGVKAKWITEYFSATSYITAGADDNKMTEDVPIVMGVESESEVFDLGIIGKANYISDLNNVSASSRMDFQLKSEYSLGDRWNSNLELGWNVFGSSDEEYTSSVSSLANASNDYTVHANASDNLSVLNAKVKCYPFRNLKLSLNYYHYSQNKAKIGRYDPSNYIGGNSNGSLWANRVTNGYNTELGSEINVSADLQMNSGIYSTLLAGWYNPGEAYEESSGDENVFEIRGEIVVSF
ncbi:MAG: hypothetical protein KAI43_13435 [Candidatus Aureabacteria bacterium]|nr:hypothetical protein [Candidatus Auribacterota bacterium]